MISVDGKGKVFQKRWNYKGNRLNKDIRKKIKERSNEFNWEKAPD